MSASLGFGNPENVRKVRDRYPARLTKHLLDIIKLEPDGPIARQFVPDERELASRGDPVPWESLTEFKTPSGVERKYIRRVVVTITTNCGAFCRFCFRKQRAIAKKPNMSGFEIERAVDYVRGDSRINEVLISGGDPFTVPKLLEYSLGVFRRIPHVNPLRIGTRMPIVDPKGITVGMADMVASYQEKDKPVEVGIHINHPAEITDEAKEAFCRLRKRGIFLYSQTVILKGINNNADTLLELFSKLRNNGVQPLYVFNCMPIQGGDHFRTMIQDDMRLMDMIIPHSGRIRPHYTILTRFGKVPGTSDRIVEIRGDKVTLRTQYNAESPGNPGCSPVEYLNGGG